MCRKMWTLIITMLLPYIIQIWENHLYDHHTSIKTQVSVLYLLKLRVSSLCVMTESFKCPKCWSSSLSKFIGLSRGWHMFRFSYGWYLNRWCLCRIDLFLKLNYLWALKLFKYWFEICHEYFVVLFKNYIYIYIYLLI